MFYPESMTEQEIMEFEYELNRIIDTERGEGQFWAVNAELQVAAEESRDVHYDELERDHDEAYEPDCDSWYDEQYELDTDYI